VPSFVPKELRPENRSKRGKAKASTIQVSFANRESTIDQQDGTDQIGSAAKDEESQPGPIASTVVASPLGGNVRVIQKQPSRPTAAQYNSQPENNKNKPGRFGSLAKSDASRANEVADLSHLCPTDPTDMSMLSQGAESGVKRLGQLEVSKLPERVGEPRKPDGIPTLPDDSPTKKRRSEYRNDDRWRQMDSSDADLLGKLGGHYLSPDPNSFTPDPILGPDDSFTPPDWFLPTVTKVARTAVVPPLKPDVRFDMTEKARTYNSEKLEEMGYDVGRLLLANVGTTMGFSSEFRPMDQLEPLLGQHPNFPAVKRFITEGMPFTFKTTLDDATKATELQAALNRGNHKSAESEAGRLLKLIAKDVKHGFSLPITKETARLIKGGAAQPLGLVSQWSLNPDGSRIQKDRMTQDLSFAVEDNANSINKRVDMDAYPEMVYGWCFPRMLHFIVALRQHHPDKRILIAKYDYSDAYRRMAHDAEAAAQTLSAIGESAYIALRLTFGGSPNPPAWCAASEMVTDLANEISQCDDWNHETLFSPAQQETPKPVLLPDSIPISPAVGSMSVIPHPTQQGKVDVFIDDLINVFLDTGTNRRRQPHVVPLAIHVTTRPHAGTDSEPVPRRPLISLPKLLAEGSPAELQIVLGWRLNTRRLIVSLPDDKFIAWTRDIEDIVKTRRVSREQLESVIGRLNHAAAIMPLTRHFLGRLRALLASKKAGYRYLNVRAEALEDLALWIKLLTMARLGWSLNCLVTRRPTRVHFSDSCPYGVGGYSISGRAWRIHIPKLSVLHGNRRVNNFLEFLGMAIGVALGDNTSAIGWLFNTSKLSQHEPCHSAHLFLARLLTTQVMEARACLASQHLNGKMNVVADLLSFAAVQRDGKRHPIAHDNPADDELTMRFHLYYHDQIPANFEISILPPIILSWALQALQIAESSLTPNKKQATSHETGSGDVGSDSAKKQAFNMTSTSVLYALKSAPSSAKPSLPASDPQPGRRKGGLEDQVRSQYLQGLSKKPQATWLRRSGAITNQAPCTTKTEPTFTHS
jgi:hypothetical protein